MRFTSPIPFEIPDDVWVASDAPLWTPSARSYRATAYRDAVTGQEHSDIEVVFMPIDRIVPPTSAGTARFLVPDRLLPVLRAIVEGGPLPAVLGQQRDDDSEADVELVDGAHRFYAAAALGLTHLPVSIRPYWEP